MRIIKPFLACLLFAPLFCRCQEKFIEVTVSDTAWVKPDEFVYTIASTSAYEETLDTAQNNEPYDKRLGILRAKEKAQLDSIKAILVKNKFNMLPPSIKFAYTSSGETILASIDVFTTSTDSLQLLYNIIDNDVYVKGYISSMAAHDEDMYTKKLYGRLLRNAKEKALSIAAFSGVKLGNILSVKEQEQESESGGWTAYPPLSSLSISEAPGWHTTISPKPNYLASNKSINELYQLNGKLTVRFAVE